MILRTSALLGLCLAGTAAAAPPPRAPVALMVPVGLQILDGTPAEPEARPTPPRPAPARGRPAPASRAAPVQAAPAPAMPAPAAAPEPPPARSAAALVIDAAAQQLAAGPLPWLATGAPPSAAARAVLDGIAVRAGLDPARLVASVDAPRAVARFLLERLRDRDGGAARLEMLHGRPGEIAVAGWQRARDRFQVLALSPEQSESAVDLVAAGLVVAQLADAVADPRHLLLVVDPGPGVDPARFERAVVAERRVARCLRPLRAGLDRAYQLDVLRDGERAAPIACADPWRAPIDPPGGPLVASQPDAGPESGGGTLGGEPGTGLGLPMPPRAAPPYPSPSPPAPPGAFVVTDGPDGPVVRRVPEE